MTGIRVIPLNSLTIEVLVSRCQDKLKGSFTDPLYVMKTKIVMEKFQKWKSQVQKFINMNSQSLLGKRYLLSWQHMAIESISDRKENPKLKATISTEIIVQNYRHFLCSPKIWIA